MRSCDGQIQEKGFLAVFLFADIAYAVTNDIRKAILWIKKGRGSAEAEKSRKKLEKLFLTIPAWKVGDPAVPMCILPEFPLLETPKDMGLDQILHSY